MIRSKNVIRLVFFLVFLALTSSVFFYRYFLINNVLLSRIKLESQRLVGIYSKTILNNDLLLIQALQKGYNIDSIKKNLSINFIKNSLNFFNSTNLEQITLYDNLHVKLLSSNSKNYINKYDNNFSFYLLFHFIDKFFIDITPMDNLIKSEKTFSIIFYSVFSNDDLTGEARKSIVKTYCPIFNEKDFRINGFFEIITDITEELDKIDKVTVQLLITFTFLLSLLCTVVIFVNRNVQKTINKQIRTNRELQEAKSLAEAESSAKTEFLANISHELRTPLNSIIGFSEIIISDSKNKIKESQYINYVNDINSSGKHLLDLINDILDFSKAIADKLKVENIEIDLNKICQSSMRFFKPRAEKGGINLLEILPEKHFVIKADPKRLKQALLNLLSNSVKFTPYGGTVSIEVRINELYDKVLIIVKDTGIGIAEKDVPKALSVFYQIDNKLNRKYEGTGLGLPLTKKLVELMDGVFDISSKENVGTTITLTFPYQEEQSNNIFSEEDQKEI